MLGNEVHRLDIRSSSSRAGAGYDTDRERMTAVPSIGHRSRCRAARRGKDLGGMQTTYDGRSGRPSTNRRGLLLVVPAALAWALTVVRPTVRLVVASFDPVRAPLPDVVVGSNNYTTALANGFGAMLPAALFLAALPLAVFVVIGPL